MLRRSPKNPILPQISTPRTLCVTSSLLSVWRRGPGRKRNPRSARMKHLRSGEHARNARRKRKQRRNYCRESRMPCVVWKIFSKLWEAQEMMFKRHLHEGAAPHHYGETVADQGGVHPPNRILPVRAGEVQVDPSPHEGKNFQDFCWVERYLRFHVLRMSKRPYRCD